MFRSFIGLASFAAMSVALPVTAQDDNPYLEKGQFCIREKAAVDRRASEEAAATFASLHQCGAFCSDAGHLRDTAPERRLIDIRNRCDTAFSQLPTEIQSRFGAAPDVGDMAAAAGARSKAEECKSLAAQYPRLASSRRDYSFTRCTQVCENSADRIEESGYDVASFAADCEEHYTGAKARIATQRRN